MPTKLKRRLRAWLGLGPRCPICGEGRFKPYRGRPDASCLGCGAKERHRLMALVLPHVPVGARTAALPVVHVAPEAAIARLLHRRFPRTYRPADIDPDQYRGSPVPLIRLDLTDPLAAFDAGTLAGFVHSHVLEHLPVPLDRVLPAMNACLAPGGFHLFQLPIVPGRTDEDLSPDLSPAEREQRFGQHDHMRQVGAEDLYRDVLRHFDGFRRLDVAALVSPRALRRARVPPEARDRDTAHSVYAFLKPG